MSQPAEDHKGDYVAFQRIFAWHSDAAMMQLPAVIATPLPSLAQCPYLVAKHSVYSLGIASRRFDL